MDTTYEDELSDHARRVEEAATAWRAKWPNHCPACGGWGGAPAHQSHPYGMGFATEYFCDPCEALEPQTCHRCNQDGLTQDGDGPCQHCGWNYDDGEPSF